jgi:urease accessory protein
MPVRSKAEAPFHVPSSARTQGLIYGSFAMRDGRSYVADVHEEGGWRLRHPHSPICEAVIINTGGGIVGGDKINLDFNIGDGADVVITSQAAEKIYKAQEDEAQVHISLRLGHGAQVGWLPQEMILFDGARFKRRLDVDMEEDSRLTMIEATVFGRLAMGEHIIAGSLRDRWRIRRGKKLIFAEDVVFEGSISEHLDLPPIGGGARASALILHIAPNLLEEAEQLRHHLSGHHFDVEWGVSLWNNMLVMRLLSHRPDHLRLMSQMALTYLRGHKMPRVWQ